MRLGDLLGDQLIRRNDELSVFEGPLGSGRSALSRSESLRCLRALEDVIASTASHVAGGRRVRVGILSNHRIETYLAVLAAVLGTHTFVPLNPKFPMARLNSIVDLANLDMVMGDVSSRPVFEQLDGTLPYIDISSVAHNALAVDLDAETIADIDVWIDGALQREIDSADIVYVMFTSGSTGQPKGVPISYGNLAAYVNGVTELLDIPSGWRFSQFFDLSFDLSMHDIFVSQRTGGVLVAPSPVDLMMPAAHVARERLDMWFSVPVLGAQLGGSAPKEGYPGLACMLFCGEALPMETVVACRPWLRASGTMWNLYGPTEATIAFTASEVTNSERSGGNASIGTAFGDNATALLADDGSVSQSMAVGAEGELLLGGPQVFAGYSTNAASPFVDGSSRRYYRSGDLVRVDSEGIYFRGRVDSQVKFRGYRIELGEIEVAARAAFGLKTVAAVIVGEHTSARIVFFYVTGESSEAPEPKRLEGVLPKYMVPSEFIGMDALPVNQNGKIDRRALAAR